MSVQVLNRDARIQKNAETLELMTRDVGKAAALMDEPVRLKIREKSFAEQLCPTTALTAAEMTYDFQNTLAAIVEVEPDVPGAIQVPLGGIAGETQFMGLKAKITLSRLTTLTFTQDTELLKIHQYDILDVITALLTLEIEAACDSAWVYMHRTACGSAANVALACADGQPNWVDYGSGLTPAGFVDQQGITLRNPSSMPTSVCLMNLNSRNRLHRVLAQNSATPDIASNVARNGYTDENYQGLRVLSTIKKTLIANGEHLLYADPQRTCVTKFSTDTTVKVKSDAPWIEVSAWRTWGAMTPVPNAMAIAQFNF